MIEFDSIQKLKIILNKILVPLKAVNRCEHGCGWLSFTQGIPRKF
jgi:hypothetical protein